MQRKTKIIILISLTSVLGLSIVWLTGLSLSLMSHLEGYIGYCSSIRLPNILNIILAETVLVILICYVCIYSKFYQLSKIILKYALIALTINVVFMAYKITQYPLLVKISSIWNARLTTEGVLNHPLIYISIVHSMIILILSYINNEILDKTFVKVILGIIVLLLLTEIILILNTEYVRCQG